MKCPSCASELTPVKTRTALIHLCPNCKGVWFDSGEFLEFVTSLTESEVISPQTPQLFKPRQVPPPHTVKEKPKICPRCTLVMQTFNYAYDSNIFLDKCAKCRGIWTDGGEAQRVAAHLKINPQVAGIAKTLIERDQTSADLTELGEVMENPYIALESFGGGVPISDDTSTQTLPVVTLSIISVCVLLHVAQLILRADSETLFDRFGFIPAQPFSVGLITSLFLHAGLVHLIVNMLFFWVFGDNVEDKFGRSNFIFFYLACGIAGNLAHALFTPDQSIPLVGATAAYIKKRIEKPKPP